MRLISRKEAAAQGLTFYFTGKPCSFGHIAQRYVSCHRCLGCQHVFCAHLREETKRRKLARPLTARATAKAAGQARYKTGKPCTRGHYADRLTINDACTKCKSELPSTRNPDTDAEYRKANAERYRMHTRNRRAKQRQLEGAHTRQDVENRLKAQRYRCAYCRCRLRSKYAVDHIQPLLKNGSNSASNIQITCRPCNLRKWAKDPIDFARETGRLI